MIEVIDIKNQTNLIKKSSIKLNKMKLTNVNKYFVEF